MSDTDLNLATSDTPFFTLLGLETKAKCVRCIDGDSVHLVFNFNNKLWKWSCRLAGINTPEIRTSNLEEKEFGYKAKQKLEELILNKIVQIKVSDLDKYGRLLVQIWNSENKYINQFMIDQKLALPYHGGRKSSFEEFKRRIEIKE